MRLNVVLEVGLRLHATLVRDVLTIELRNGRFALSLIRHLDEAKPPRPSRLPIREDLYGGDFTEFPESVLHHRAGAILVFHPTGRGFSVRLVQLQDLQFDFLAHQVLYVVDIDPRGITELWLVAHPDDRFSLQRAGYQ